MAMLRVDDIISLATNGYHDRTTWQVALDPDFNQIIDQSIEDRENVKKWHTPLPKINGDGFYADLDKLYARIKVYIDNTESPWYIMEPKNQNNQHVIFTKDGSIVEEGNSLELGMK